MLQSHSYTQKNHKELIVALLVALLIAALVFFTIPSIVSKVWLPALLMPAIVLGANYYQSSGSAGRTVILSFILTVGLMFSLNIMQQAKSLAAKPPLWDFHVFWVSGKVASQGLNFYAPENFHKVADPLDLGEEFTREILDVGFWYPPATMFLFAPLGLFDIQAAALIWYILQVVVLILDIFLLWKIFLSEMGWIGLAFTFAIGCVFPPIINNIWFAQINFIVLLMFLLFWQDRQNARSGIWLAIGIFLKPYLALLLVYLLIKRHWKAIISCLLTAISALLLSLFVFGSNTFLSYFTNNPTNNLPPGFFNELDKGNLYAFLWRLNHTYLGIGSLGLTQLIFGLLSLALISFTGWLIYRLSSTYDEWALAVAISLALLIYPNTGTNYYVVMLAPILLLWLFRSKLPGNVWTVAIFLTIETAFFGYHGGWSELVTFAMFFNWLFFCLFGVYLIRDLRENRQKVVLNKLTS